MKIINNLLAKADQWLHDKANSKIWMWLHSFIHELSFKINKKMKTEDSNKMIAEFLGYIPKDAPGNKVYQHNLARISTTWWDRVIM